MISKVGLSRAPARLAVILACAVAAGAAEPATIHLDASEAPRRILHASLVIPAAPGPLTLAYPEWIPGEHGPTGPVTDLAGLRLTAAGKPLSWRRDPVNMYAFHCEVPPGARAVEARLDYLMPSAKEGFSSAASSSARLALLSWNQVVLYPLGARPSDLLYAARLKIPSGWKHGTALPVAREAAGEIEFAPVALATLVDSPVLIGAHFRSIGLSDPSAPAVQIDLAADGDAALEAPASWVGSLRSLVREAEALFGAHHFGRYRFLLSLSDQIAHFGLEHHESSDNRVEERALIDEAPREMRAGLLPHEFVHSWNGKYRRPAGLAADAFSEPMKGEMLWVYEGLTEYLGGILTARSGLLTADQYREALAFEAAEQDHVAGRTWRPVADTAVAAQRLFRAADEWESWRRGVDFYAEGDLIWLEADVLIRERTGGARSLDDFCRRFHGPPSGPPAVRPYTYEDVLAALGEVAPHDWRAFFDARLNSTEPRAPLGGIEAGGWRLAYAEEKPEHLDNVETVRKTVDERFSIGVRLEEDGRVADVVPGLPAAAAGVGPGMRLLAVNGRVWSEKILRDAIRATKGSAGPLRLLVENGGYVEERRLDYQGGLRYPRLERVAGRPDVLSRILEPKAAQPPPS